MEVSTIDGLIYQILILLIGFAGGALLFSIWRKLFDSTKLSVAEAKAKEIIAKAEEEARNLKREAQIEAKNELVELRRELERRFNKETKEKREELLKYEQRLNAKESKLDKKLEAVEKREKNLARLEQEAEELKNNLATLHLEEIKKLEAISGITAEEAKKMLMANLEKELEAEMARRIKLHEEEVKQHADRKAREILATALQRTAVDHTVDSMVSVVSLPDEDMKGRIIGREGRNIRTLESLTGISVIIDDTPQAVVLSGFNTIKREIARISLEKLIQDGRIHPARIEEIVAKTTAEMETGIRETGERVAMEMGVQGLTPGMIVNLGKLQYRTSYGQNVLQHSIEVAHLASIMAAELGCDVQLAKRAGLLHDIGKAIDHEVEGSHSAIGADFAKKQGEPWKVVNAIASHHEDCPPETIEAILVATADAISAARQGARHETLEAYVKRIEALEKIASSFDAVQQAFALQAGREVRVIVKPEGTDDATACKLARDIRLKIEQELEYPGQIKVVVIRETRAIDYAK